MEQEFDNNFERFLRTGADDYRMYPSERVWNNIHDRLHGKKRMFAIAFVALAFVVLLFVYRDQKDDITMLAGGGQKPPATTQTIPAPLTRAATTPQNNTGAAQMYSPVRPYNVDAPVSTAPGNFDNPEPVTRSSNGVIAQSRQFSLEDDVLQAETSPVTTVELPKTIIENFVAQDAARDVAENIPNPETASSPGDAHEAKPLLKKQAPTTPAPAATKLAPARKTNRVMTQFYITPSISYRSLYDTRPERKFGDSGNLDQAVYHKPGIGMEAGVSWIKQIDNRLRFKAGLQLNFNQYNIKATITQRASAPFDLTGNNRDLSFNSRYENRSDGVFPEWLENKNLQISIPIGLEFVVTGNERAQLNIGTTLQPSYLIQDKSYLLSTDLKRYASTADLKLADKQDFLIRRLNMNAAVEAFFTFNTANSRWHIGPQLRYQLFSSYNKVYPFKENLFDYGFKIGFSKIIR